MSGHAEAETALSLLSLPAFLDQPSGQPGARLDDLVAIASEIPSDGTPSPTEPTSGGSRSGKVFKCVGYGNCQMAFARNEHLVRHIRKHTGEKPFVCHCSKAFSRLDNLRQHALTIHPDFPEQNAALLAAYGSVLSPSSSGKKNNRPPLNRSATTSKVNGASSFLYRKHRPSSKRTVSSSTVASNASAPAAYNSRPNTGSSEILPLTHPTYLQPSHPASEAGSERHRKLSLPSIASWITTVPGDRTEQVDTHYPPHPHINTNFETSPVYHITPATPAPSPPPSSQPPSSQISYSPQYTPYLHPSHRNEEGPFKFNAPYSQQHWSPELAPGSALYSVYSPPITPSSASSSTPSMTYSPAAYHEQFSNPFASPITPPSVMASTHHSFMGPATSMLQHRNSLYVRAEMCGSLDVKTVDGMADWQITTSDYP